MNAETKRDVPALDLALEDLRSGAPGWAALPLRAKIAMLEALPPKILDVAPRMVAAAAEAKGIASDSAWVAEEWTTNIWTFVQVVNTQILVLKRVLAGCEPVNAETVHTRPDGQVVVDVFPATGYDRLLLNGADELYGSQRIPCPTTASPHPSHRSNSDMTTHVVAPIDLPVALEPSIFAALDEADRQAEIPQRLHSQLRDAGAFRMLTPREYGGSETPLTEVLEVYERFGHIDASVGLLVWNANFGFLAAMHQ
jgi:Acyl-CoA dehydrogenase, N-terminal domain